MALETVTNLSDLVATNPTSADPKNQGDDHIRNIKKALEEAFAGFSGAVLITGADGGAVNTYTLTPEDPIEAYGTRMLVLFSPTVTNTGGVTLNISGLGAKNLKAVDGAVLVADDLVAGSVYMAAYNGAEFRLLSVTKEYVDLVREYATQLAFSTALPAQAGNAGKYIRTNGAVASWESILPPQIVLSERAANAQLTLADTSKLIKITAGTFTQTFAAFADLASGWFCYYQNAGSGQITIPDSDGRTNWIMYPGEVRLFQCDGAKLTSVVLNSFSLTMTTSGTFTRPPGYRKYRGALWAGGGSGCKDGTTAYRSGGGGGGCALFEFSADVIGLTETITIGAGGAAVTAASTNGLNGGNSFFGTLLQAEGGKGGTWASLEGSSWGYGGRGYTNAVTLTYVDGGESQAGSGGNAVWGGAAGSGPGVAALKSIFGGNGGLGSSGGSGGNGVAPGGGGGATGTGASSGAGARGEFRIEGIV